MKNQEYMSYAHYYSTEDQDFTSTAEVINDSINGQKITGIAEIR